jgi:subtilisin family serine protease
MPNLEHLPLIRLAPLPERRKRPGFGAIPEREFQSHGHKLRDETLAVLFNHNQRPKRPGVDPSLILKVQLDGAISENDWARVGLTVLADDPDKTLILFASDAELTAFRDRVEKYLAGPENGSVNPPYSNFVGAIELVADVGPEDRIGIAARAAGFCSQEDFHPDSDYIFDITLWDLADRAHIDAVVGLIEKIVTAAGGEVRDRYLNRSLFLLRVAASGAVFQQLLDVPEIAEVELPPSLDVEADQILDLGLSDVNLDIASLGELPLVGVLDSGISAHPLLAPLTFAAQAFPRALNTADVKGHGTGVAGIAIYGDIRSCLENGAFAPGARVVSAKVVNDQGQFPDNRLVVNQMRDCIETLNREHGVRIFNISLADHTRIYSGAKPSAWAAILDELVRELDIVIILAAGNRRPPCPNDEPERAITDYPGYLFDDDNRLFEPATSALSVTVGAIAHGSGLPGGVYDAVNIRPITGTNCPAPFTRIGFGVQGAIKPEFCDYGGTHIFDGMMRSTRGGDHFPSAGVILTNHSYLERLFTAKSATSFAAPRVAFKAAQILKEFPDASANLLRALMANAAEVPPESVELLQAVENEACQKALGYGLIDAECAIASDDNRVVLWAQETIGIDHFAVFEVPIPADFQNEPGLRWIKTTLAFDPPVRHTRADYLGITMNFRLIRGWREEQVFEHFRKRDVAADGRHPDLPGSNDCDFFPRKSRRDIGTLQSGVFTMKRNVPAYGDTYYLVVRAEGGWATNLVNSQSFAVVVEIGHQSEIPLHAQIKQRVALRVRAQAQG